MNMVDITMPFIKRIVPIVFVRKDRNESFLFPEMILDVSTETVIALPLNVLLALFHTELSLAISHRDKIVNRKDFTFQKSASSL